MQTNWGRRVAVVGVVAAILGLMLWGGGGENSNGRRMAAWFTGLAQRHFGSRHNLSSNADSKGVGGAHRMRNGTSIPGLKNSDPSLSCTVAGRITNEEGTPLKDARITVREV